MKRPWLAPLVPLYAAGVSLCNRKFENGSEQIRRLLWPVISIGNLSTGGSGKTPLTITLAKLLQQRGFLVDVLSRGYGRRSSVSQRVNPKGSADEFGDEPLLIAREADVPVCVAAQRYEAGLLAESAIGQNPNGIQSHIHILDDGFQHRQLHRDVDILLLNLNDCSDTLLPAGNLRERFSAASRADVIAVPYHTPEIENRLKALGAQGQTWQLHRRIEVPEVPGPAVAFCGIARPEQFFAGLESAGVHLAMRKAFRDHYAYTRQDIEWILQRGKSAGACIVLTTEKDAVRLGQLVTMFPPDLPLKIARLRVEIANETAALQWLFDRLAQTSLQPPL